MRRRRIIMFFAMIMSIAIIGVGFAAWIITAPTNADYKEGTVTVDTVEVQGWSFNAYWVADDAYVNDGTETGKLSNPVIVFGTPKTPDTTIEDPFLDNSNIGVENMVAYLYVQGVKINDGSYGITDKAKISLDFYKKETSGENTKITKVEKTMYDDYFTTKLSVNGTEVSELTAKQLTDGVVVKVEFIWATDTDGTNPYDYFNKMGYDAGATAASTFLTGLYNAVNGLSFRVDLTADKAK